MKLLSEFADIVNDGLVSVYSWEKDWDSGNKIKMKMILKTNFFIIFTLDKSLIKKVYGLIKRSNNVKPSLHCYYKE